MKISIERIGPYRSRVINESVFVVGEFNHDGSRFYFKSLSSSTEFAASDLRAIADQLDKLNQG